MFHESTSQIYDQTPAGDGRPKRPSKASPEADAYEANVARLQEQLEPLSEHPANLHATLADIESRFLVP